MLAHIGPIGCCFSLKDAEERLTSGRTGEERRLAEQQEQNEKLRLLVAQMEVRLDEANNNNALLSNEKNKLAGTIPFLFLCIFAYLRLQGSLS